MSGYSRIRAADVHVPERRQSEEELVDLIREAVAPGIKVPPRVIAHMYHIRGRAVAPASWYPSDLAAAATERALRAAGWDAADVDLLIYASVSEDVEEPATAHIVADKIGARCPVFDVKNACNSVLNSIEVADALIRSGTRHDRVVIATGEMLSRHTREVIRDRRELVEALASYSVGDMGAAVLVERSAEPGILATKSAANSRGWRAATIPNIYMQQSLREEVVGEGSVRSGDLWDAASAVFPDVHDCWEDLGLKVRDMALVCVHQPSVEFARRTCERFGVADDQVLITVREYGNVGAATLPLQLRLAQESGRLREGDLVLLLGTASGASVGAVVLRW